MISKLKKGQSLILVRYGSDTEKYYINEHIKTLNKNGYCWFGKIGKTPNANILEMITAEEHPYIIMFASGKSFLCEINGYSMQKPEFGYPDYYESELYESGWRPSIYFKLVSITELSFDELKNFYVNSTGKSVYDTMSRPCMTSFLFISYGEGNKIKIKAEKKKLGKDECRYKIDNVCTMKSCVNYQYRCEHPSLCIKQKR